MHKSIPFTFLKRPLFQTPCLHFDFSFFEETYHFFEMFLSELSLWSRTGAACMGLPFYRLAVNDPRSCAEFCGLSDLAEKTTFWTFPSFCSKVASESVSKFFKDWLGQTQLSAKWSSWNLSSLGPRLGEGFGPVGSSGRCRVPLWSFPESSAAWRANGHRFRGDFDCLKGAEVLRVLKFSLERFSGVSYEGFLKLSQGSRDVQNPAPLERSCKAIWDSFTSPTRVFLFFPSFVSGFYNWESPKEGSKEANQIKKEKVIGKLKILATEGLARHSWAARPATLATCKDSTI